MTRSEEELTGEIRKRLDEIRKRIEGADAASVASASTSDEMEPVRESFDKLRAEMKKFRRDCLIGAAVIWAFWSAVLFAALHLWPPHL